MESNKLNLTELKRNELNLNLSSVQLYVKSVLKATELKATGLRVSSVALHRLYTKQTNLQFSSFHFSGKVYLASSVQFSSVALLTPL